MFGFITLTSTADLLSVSEYIYEIFACEACGALGTWICHLLYVVNGL